MKEDKGHGKLFLYRTNYIEKCCNIINTNQFLKKIPQNPRNQSTTQQVLFDINLKTK